jgi:serine/threonine protein kinase
VKFDNSLALFQHLLSIDEDKMLENLPSFTQKGDTLYSEVTSLIDAHYKNKENTEFKALIGKQAERLVDDENIHNLVGEQVGTYKLSQKLGHGGMGAVYLGERNDGQLQQKVAIKFVYPSIVAIAGSDFLKREAQHLANLDHPNIAKIFTIDMTQEGLPFIVMEYIDGLPIDQYCEQNNLGLKARLRLCQKVCSAVHEAHQNMVIHADIKPSNILVDKQGEPKLMDFGIAQHVSHSSGAEDSLSSSPTFLAASRGYASPEHINGGSLTTSSDVYSLGQVLSICVSKIERNKEIDAIIKCACSTTPNERFDTVRTLSASIGDFLNVWPLLWYKHDPVYKYSKWLKRAPVSAISSVFLPALLIFIGVILTLKNNELLAANQKSQGILKYYENILSATSPSLSNSQNLSAADLLKYGAELIHEERINDPSTKAHLLITLANSLLNLGLIRDAQNIVSNMDVNIEAGQLIKAKTAYLLGSHDEAIHLIQSENNNLTQHLDALLILAKISDQRETHALTLEWLKQAKTLGGSAEAQFKRIKVALEIAIKSNPDEVNILLNELNELNALDNSDITQVWYQAFLAQQYIADVQPEKAGLAMEQATVMAEKIYHNAHPDLAYLYDLAFNVAINTDDQRSAPSFLNKQVNIYRQLQPNYQNELLNLYLKQFNLHLSDNELALARTYNTLGVKLCGDSESADCRLFLKQKIEIAFRLNDHRSVIEAVEKWEVLATNNMTFDILSLISKSYLALNSSQFEPALRKLSNLIKNSQENAEYINILVISGRAEEAVSAFNAAAELQVSDAELLAYTNAFLSIDNKQKASELLKKIDKSKLSVEEQQTVFKLFQDNSLAYTSKKTKFTYQLQSGYQLLKSRRVTAITSPTSGDILAIGKKHPITWQVNKLPGEKVAIFINAMNNFDTEGFSSWEQIQNIRWKLVSQYQENLGELKLDPYHFMANGRQSFKVLVVTELGYWAISDGLFSIASGVSINNGLEHYIEQSLLVDSITKPQAYQVYNIGEKDTIEWNNELIGGSRVAIYILHDDSTNIGNKLYADTEVIINRRWYNVVINAPNTGVYSLDPAQFYGQGNNYKILIIADNGKWAVSDERFTVVNPH